MSDVGLRPRHGHRAERKKRRGLGCIVGLVVVALGLGIFSAIIQVTMNWAQRSVSPTRATVIYTGEPVWAGIFGRLAGERLPLLALFGGE